MSATVLFIHTAGNWIRGSENALLMALGGLDKDVIQPLLVCGNDALADTARARGIEAIVQDMPQLMLDGSSRQIQGVRWLRAVRAIRSLAQTRSVQLVYCNGGSSCQIGYYAAKAVGRRVVCHIHSPYNRRHILLYRLHRANRVLFVSRAIQATLLKKQAFHGRCEVVYNGVDTKLFAPPKKRDPEWRRKLSISSNSVVFGQVSSLIPRKGIDVLLRAFRRVHDEHATARLVIVGDGPHRHECEQLAYELGLTNAVAFTGQADPLPYYQHVFDVNVLASRSDAFPLSLLEAAACGLPNLAANVDGIPEAVSDGQTGLLFESEDHLMLANRMSILLKDEALRQKLGEASRRRASASFSSESYCATIQRIVCEEAALSVAPDGGAERYIRQQQTLPQ
jgi:glycosyltransferase involved in cell wall biosynthesis